MVQTEYFPEANELSSREMITAETQQHQLKSLTTINRQRMKHNFPCSPHAVSQRTGGVYAQNKELFTHLLYASEANISLARSYYFDRISKLHRRFSIIVSAEIMRE